MLGEIWTYNATKPSDGTQKVRPVLRKNIENTKNLILANGKKLSPYHEFLQFFVIWNLYHEFS